MEHAGQKNIIYAAECVRHKKIYIGQRKNQLNKRFCGHRYDIKEALNNSNSTDIGGTELSDHFAKTPHGAGDLRVRVLDSSEKWNEVDRLTMEDFYMSKLKTIKPQGLNARHGLFAKLYYKQFPSALILLYPF